MSQKCSRHKTSMQEADEQHHTNAGYCCSVLRKAVCPPSPALSSCRGSVSSRLCLFSPCYAGRVRGTMGTTHIAARLATSISEVRSCRGGEKDVNARRVRPAPQYSNNSIRVPKFKEIPTIKCTFSSSFQRRRKTSTVLKCSSRIQQHQHKEDNSSQKTTTTTTTKVDHASM